MLVAGSEVTLLRRKGIMKFDIKEYLPLELLQEAIAMSRQMSSREMGVDVILVTLFWLSHLTILTHAF